MKNGLNWGLLLKYVVECERIGGWGHAAWYLRAAVFYERHQTPPVYSLAA